MDYILMVVCFYCHLLSVLYSIILSCLFSNLTMCPSIHLTFLSTFSACPAPVSAKHTHNYVFLILFCPIFALYFFSLPLEHLSSHLLFPPLHLSSRLFFPLLPLRFSINRGPICSHTSRTSFQFISWDKS